MLDFLNPLSNGKIPAAKRAPHQHWKYISNDVSFVRTITDGIAAKVKKRGTTPDQHTLLSKDLKKRIDSKSIEYTFIEKVDFGGMDGHVPEGSDMLDLEEIRVTRCSTSRSAITAYFCGVDVTMNQDVALGFNGKMNQHGTKSFRQYLQCRYEQGVADGGTHRRMVYRLGVGCKDSLAGYSHAFSIVAQPTGTYYWLQSYISHYSLSTWMKKVDKSKQSGLAGILTYGEIMTKLDGIDRLMKIDSWTTQANTDYLDLFNVDKDLETASGNRGRKIKKWNADHRLQSFYWDEACEYPVPKSDNNGNQIKFKLEDDKLEGDAEMGDEAENDVLRNDKCTMLLPLY